MLCTRTALTPCSTAQTFSTLHSFTALTNNTNSDGAGPVAGLVSSGDTLFGTAAGGGTAGGGVVFAVEKNGTGFRVLHNFAQLDSNDGSGPAASLIESAGILYGTTTGGGTSGNGTIFAVDTSGTGYSILHSFVIYFSRPEEPLEGAFPTSKLTLGSNTLYGTTWSGGSTGSGSIFAISTNGSAFKTLFAFTAGEDGESPNDLVLSNNVLYGSAGGGTLGGSIFAIDIAGGTFRTLYNFTNVTEGRSPRCGLVLSGSRLYGVTYDGGTVQPNDIGWGTIFGARTDGTQYDALYRFSTAAFAGEALIPATNTDGALPAANLILSGAKLYGTTYTGGTFGNGTVFAVNTDGTEFTNLHNFSALTMTTNSDGAFPHAPLLLQGGTLYGTTSQGGTSGNGTVFAIRLASVEPRLTISVWDNYVVLSWPAEAAGFDLYSSTNLAAPVWTLVPTVPVSVNGQNSVTNLLSGTERFYRLQQ